MTDRTELFKIMRDAENKATKTLQDWFIMSGHKPDVGFKNSKIDAKTLACYGTRIMVLSTLIKGVLPEIAPLYLEDLTYLMVEYQTGKVDEDYIRKYIEGLLVVMGTALVEKSMEFICDERTIEV
jgi:hypothetical protein